MTRHGQTLSHVEAMLLRLTCRCTLTPDSQLPDGPILFPSAGLPCQHRPHDAPSVYCRANIGSPSRYPSCSPGHSGIVKSP